MVVLHGVAVGGRMRPAARRAAIFVCAVAVLAIGTYGVKVTLTPSVSARERIVIAQVADFFLYAPIYIATDAGLFNDAGLDVTLISTGGDEKSWAAVISGSAQYGVGDPTFVAISAQRGQPGRAIASVVNGVPFWGITLRKDIPIISKPAQLAPYTVATFPAPSTAYILQSDMFKRGGLPPKIRQGAFGALLPMLKAGQADIALELEPNVSTAVEMQGATIVYSMAETYGDFAITGLTASPDYLASHEAQAAKVVCALRKALEFIRMRPKDSLAILEKRFPEINSSVAERALHRVVDEKIIPTSAAISENAWQKAIALRVEAGDLADAKPFGEYVDNKYALTADRECRLK
jgi:NitT/TauT family transport system substrate-binding protein